MLKLKFLGAARTVTGSKYLLTSAKARVLIDCGLFQGFKTLRLRNWADAPVDPSTLDAVILTHAHLDHSGYLPLLVKNGYRGPIYATAGTRDLCEILLPDSGYLQEEDAAYANKGRFSKHSPALPLYTEEDAKICLKQFVTVPDLEPHSLKDLVFDFHPCGHLLGASSVRVQSQKVSILFSGDIGRSSDPMTPRRPNGKGADFVVMESTYGNRTHADIDPSEQLQSILQRTLSRGGTVLIPSFAVGRAQMILLLLHRLKRDGRIPASTPIYVNSPMAAAANRIYRAHAKELALPAQELDGLLSVANVVRDVAESKALNERRGPMVIIAASGMATGGRILHHLKTFAPDPRHAIVFVGFQAGGTRGEALVNGVPEVKIHGQLWPIRAEVVQLDTLSAHADGPELLTWLKSLDQKPRQVFVTHGEPAAAEALAAAIEQKFGYKVSVPEFNDEVTLQPGE